MEAEKETSKFAHVAITQAGRDQLIKMRREFSIRILPGFGFVVYRDAHGRLYRTARGVADALAYSQFGRTLAALEDAIFTSRSSDDWFGKHPRMAEAREIHALLKNRERTATERAWVVLFELNARYARFVTFLLKKRKRALEREVGDKDILKLVAKP